MNAMVKSFLINLVVFMIVALTMLLFGTTNEAFILLFKIWVWISSIIIGYFVIVQIQNGSKKNKDEK